MSPANKFQLLQRIRELPGNFLFAYTTIFLLQLKVLWNIWSNKDLELGDTTSYFIYAWQWYSEHKIDLIWSPLYTLFYGSLLYLTENAYIVTTLHRMIIVLIAALLMLAIMRRLFPAAIAWLIAVWWVILPVNFNALYEVHQFAVLPILIVLLIAVQKNPGSWARGMILSSMFAITILVRNEMIIALCCFGLFCIFEEIRNRNVTTQPNFIKIIISYFLPFSIFVLILVWFFSHSAQDYNTMRSIMKVKHTVNMAQVYAYGYKQRNTDWELDPWTQNVDLIKHDFGLFSNNNQSSTISDIYQQDFTLMPSLSEMIRHNPKAVGDHFLWNLRLLPSGLQLLLFDRASGVNNPDYIPVNLQSKTALYLSIFVIALLLIAIIYWWKEREKWNSWFISNRLGWITMLCFLAVAPAIILTQRPRPEYLYCVTIFLMSVIGTSFWIIVSRWSSPRWLKVILPVFMVALIICMPNYYSDKNKRPMLQLYNQLRPFKEYIDKPNTVFLSNGLGTLVSYLGLHHLPKALMIKDVLSDISPNESLVQALNKKKINLFYLDENSLNEFESKMPGLIKLFFVEGGKQGWRVINYGEIPNRWWLFQRKQNRLISPFQIAESISFDQFSGWNKSSHFLNFEGPYSISSYSRLRWAISPSATIQVTTDKPGIYKLSISAYPAVKNTDMSIFVDGNPFSNHQFLKPGMFEDLDLNLNLKKGKHIIEFKFNNQNSENLSMLFRLLKVTFT